MASIVIMAKDPVPGTVKTRMTKPQSSNTKSSGGDGGGGSGGGGEWLTPYSAANVASSMLDCILLRLLKLIHCNDNPQNLKPVNVYLAVNCEPGDLKQIFPETYPGLKGVLVQGEGDLGDRINNVWQQIITQTKQDAPIAFFGIDSPDVPSTVLEGLISWMQLRELANKDRGQFREATAIGPTFDGGYWVLAASNFIPDLITDIAWGTEVVFAQTIDKAKLANLQITTLKKWYDIDTVTDMKDAITRIQNNNLDCDSDTDENATILAQVWLRTLHMKFKAILEGIR